MKKNKNGAETKTCPLRREGTKIKKRLYEFSTEWARPRQSLFDALDASPIDQKIEMSDTPLMVYDVK